MEWLGPDPGMGAGTGGRVFGRPGLDEEGVGDELGDAVKAGDHELLVAGLASNAGGLEDLAGVAVAHACADNRGQCGRPP